MRRNNDTRGENTCANIFFGGRVVGEVRADGYFQKRLQFSRHLLRKPMPSIAINVDVLDAAERQGAHACEIIDSESDSHYCASIAFIRARGFRVNRGMGLQLALPLPEWTTDPTNVRELREPLAEQLAFWK